MAKARFLRKTNKISTQVGGAGGDHWAVRARMATLRKDFRTAELVYLEQNQARPTPFPLCEASPTHLS